MGDGLKSLRGALDRLRELLRMGDETADEVKKMLRGAPPDRMSALDVIVRSFITAEIESAKDSTADATSLLLLKTAWIRDYEAYRDRQMQTNGRQETKKSRGKR